MTKEEELAALRAARLALLQTGGVTRVSSAGRTVEYRPAQLVELEAAISRLEAELAGGGGSSGVVEFLF